MTLINELANLLGFHKSYINSFGHDVSANEEALKKLIDAMGFETCSEQSILQSIKYLREKTYREVISTVHIERGETTDHAIVISLPNSTFSHASLPYPEPAVEYKIKTEVGEVLSKSFYLHQLDVVSHHQLDDETFTKYKLPLPHITQGYHHLSLSVANLVHQCSLIYAPNQCYNITEASPAKVWGFSTQLYSIKSKNNWGMGDFSDLKQLVKRANAKGASVIGVNPLHPLFPSNPQHCSPYSPSSRSYLNTLYIDPADSLLYVNSVAAKALVGSDEFQQKLTNARATQMVDYEAVSTLKHQVLHLLFEELTSSSTATNKPLADQFTDYKEQQGLRLLQLATYDALYQNFNSDYQNLYGWQNWPLEFQRYDSNAVVLFQKSHELEIDYFAFLQWLAHLQLSSVSKTCQINNMPIGLYLDLAVGCDGSGVEVWANQSTYLNGAAVGAPPDQMNLLGQNWGLTPINPIKLQEYAYQPLIQSLRDNMQYAGALRIDHILGLKRQYWVAPDMNADQGIYINFPFEDILSIIALESQRNKCVVIGEDLGTVPEGFTQHMQSAGLLSYKVLFFERWESGLFKRPDAYPEQSMATVSTHDLPTLAGWWLGNDLSWREKLNLYPNENMASQEQDNRTLDRQRLLAALDDLSLLNKRHAPSQLPPEINQELLLAVQQYLAHSESHLSLIQLEDCIEVIEQANIPGTINEHPNWQQKLPLQENDLWQHPTMAKLIDILQQVRPR